MWYLSALKLTNKARGTISSADSDHKEMYKRGIGADAAFDVALPPLAITLNRRLLLLSSMICSLNRPMC